MYPRGELDDLAARKVILQARIAVRRWECAQAAAELAQPVALVDRALELWARISPFVKLLAVPAGVMLAKLLRGRSRQGGGRGGKLAALLGLIPMVVRGYQFVQNLRAAQGTRPSRPPRPRPPAAAREARPAR